MRAGAARKDYRDGHAGAGGNDPAVGGGFAGRPPAISGRESPSLGRAQCDFDDGSASASPRRCRSAD